MIDVVICTYNRAATLERTLEALAGQHGVSGDEWSVLVVDNNCTDETPAVVERHAAVGSIPGLRRIVETRKGLTSARLAGVRGTVGEWVAFIDDDCLLDDRWMAEAVRLTRSADATCGALGGRIVLDWEVEPPESLRPYGWALAEQDRGDQPCLVSGLAGAGVIVRRAALEQSGWTERPLLEDRVGDRLVSGGDVEIVARLVGNGYALHYEPVLALRHLIPASRGSRRYFVSMVRGLGASSAYHDLLVWRGSVGGWAVAVAGGILRDLIPLARRVAGSVLRRRGLTGPALDASFLLGRARGVVGVLFAGTARRRALRGAALRRA